MAAEAIMFVLIVVSGIGSDVTQTVTNTSMATCLSAQKQLNGTRTGETQRNGLTTILTSIWREVDCVPIK